VAWHTFTSDRYASEALHGTQPRAPFSPSTKAGRNKKARTWRDFYRANELPTVAQHHILEGINASLIISDALPHWFFFHDSGMFFKGHISMCTFLGRWKHQSHIDVSAKDSCRDGPLGRCIDKREYFETLCQDG
jgi:hypothetical protein